MNEDQREQIDAKEDSLLRSSANEMAVRSAAERNERTVHNQ